MKNLLKTMLALSAAAVLVFAGCSSDGGSDDTSSSSKPADTTPVKPSDGDKPVVYTVKFIVDDANYVEPVMVDANKTVAAPATDPTKEHHTFAGWKADGTDTLYDFTTKVTANLTLRAQWTVNKYTVSFDLNGATTGDAIASVEKEWNTNYTLPSTEGYAKAPAGDANTYTLLGWNTSADATDGLSGEVTVTGNVTYYLVWTTKTAYTITYKDGDSVVTTQKVVDGNKTTAAAAPVKDGYEFASWKNGSDVFDFNTVITGDITLTASYTVISYTITYVDEKNGVISEGEATASYTIETEDVTLPVKAKDGYKFEGWTLEGNPVEKIAKGSFGNKTVTAVWTVVTYNITYTGLEGATNAASNPSTYTVESSTITFAPATKERYVFAGWTPATIGAGSTGDKTIAASWSSILVTSVTVTGSSSVKLGSTIKLTATVAPSNSTATIVTWNSSNTSVATVDADGTVTGKAEGTTNITASCGGKTSAAFAVKVVDPAKVEIISITKQGGWLESSYVEWAKTTNYSSYNVYVQKTGTSSWTKLDDQLIRSYSATAGGTTVDHWRADALGLAAGTYTMKVAGCIDGAEESASAATSSAVEVKAHDRSGFAFVKSAGSSLSMVTDADCPGAYKLDGTLKDNALVIYLTANTVDSVKTSITYDSKGTKLDCTGVVEILTAMKKGFETRPVAFRIIGEVNNDGGMTSNSDFQGDFLITGSGSSKRISNGITVEGVGFDGVAKGWGARIKNASNIEIRNLMFLECDSKETDNVGLQQDNDHVWVHNCTTTYGMHGSDKDQVKGDGAMDCKKSTYITFSYNHFIDNGKCNLLGLSEGTTEGLYITYHHNWYDHSDSRHPRCRFYTAHVYNNYYDGNSKYGIGATLGSSVFAEGNYFRSCQYPILTSMQGSDVYAGSQERDPTNKATFSKENGGSIKAFNNYMTGNCTFIPYGATTYLLKGTSGTSVGSINTTADFDAYVVSNRNDTVPSTVTAYAGGAAYNNWDTDSGKMYAYTAQEPAAAKDTVLAWAGTYYGGDFTYDWSGQANPDSDHEEDMTLRALISAYKTKVVAIQGDGSSSGGSGGSDPDPTPAGTPAITLKVSSSSVSVGSSVTITVTPSDFSATPTYEFSSSDTSKATVDSNGKVTGVAAGSVTITVTATAGSETASKTIAISVIDPNAAQVCTFPYSGTFFTVSGNTSTSKGSGSYGGTTYSTCLKLESSTSVSFTVTETKTVTIVFGSTETGTIKLDGTKKTAAGAGEPLTFTVDAGTHTLTKADTCNIFYILVN